MAAPHVAGLAALILENHPEYTVAQVTAAIESTALSAASRTDAYGYGLIRADKALGIIAAPASTAVGTDLANPLSTLENQQAAFVPGRVLVKFRSGVQPASIGVLSTFIAQPTVVGEIGGVGAQVLSVTEGQEWQLVEALRSQPGVEFAQPDYIYTAQ
jgi:subtilisin family serine protease